MRFAVCLCVPAGRQALTASYVSRFTLAVGRLGGGIGGGGIGRARRHTPRPGTATRGRLPSRADSLPIIADHRRAGKHRRRGFPVLRPDNLPLIVIAVVIVIETDHDHWLSRLERRKDESQRDVGGCQDSFRTPTNLSSKPTRISFGLNVARVPNQMQF